MEEENKDVAEVQETSQENSNSQNEEVDIEDLKKRAEVSTQNFERAKKAEDELKRLKASGVTETQRDGLSTKDIIFLGKADIHEDDMDEVLDRAKNKKISVSQAYKEIKPLLDAHAEERKSAEVANTSNARRGSSAVDGETLISQARSGKYPEKDEDIQKVLKAKMGMKK